MKKRKQPIETLDTTYTLERWHDPGGYWDRQVEYQRKIDALKCLRSVKRTSPHYNYRIRKTVETVVAAV